MPKFMVFFSPGFIHITGTHSPVGAFHTDGANIDVTQKHSHHQHRCHRVDHVGNLHGAALIDHSGNDLVKHKA